MSSNLVPSLILFNTQTPLNDFFTNNKDTIIGITQIVSTIVIPILLLQLTNSFNRKNNIEENIITNKKETFKEFLEALYLLFKYHLTELSQRNEKDIQKYEELMIEVRKKLLMVASLETIEAFNKWGEFAEKENPTDKDTIVVFDRILFYLRKDLGIQDESIYESMLRKIIIRLKKIIQLEFLHPEEKYERFQFLWGKEIKIKKNSRLATCVGCIFALPLSPFIVFYAFYKKVKTRIQK